MKKVAIIQDLSSFGKCSLTAAIPVLSVMGVQACPLPTAILTAQTAFPSYYCEDLTSKMNYFTEEWSKLNKSFDGIFTGFVTGEEQIQNIFRFLDTFLKKDTVLLVDPVMGDEGEGYDIFTDELLEQMKELVKRANIITPNLTECCLLTGLSYEKLHNYSDENDFLKAVEEAGAKLQLDTNATVIITGITPPKSSEKRMVGNMYFDGNETLYSAIEFNGENYSGTGDLFASVIMGSMMRGDHLKDAVTLAQNFLSEAIHETAMNNIENVEGIHFEKFLHMLL